MGPQIGFTVFDAEFFPEVFLVMTDGFYRKIQKACNFFGGFTLFDQVGHLNFRRRQFQILVGQLLGKGVNKLSDV